MDYQFKQIEKEWQKFWAENATFKAEVDESKPKYYVLDMFPYPSGAGLHVGHPLGYIASDIFARYKRLKGFNVLHPMGYDSFGLPAEQYAIQTGLHPAKTTEANINRYREQLDNLGFSYDWSKEVRTSSPEYYKWTQWIFMQLFDSWYNKETDKAEPISTLIAKLETIPSAEINAVCDEDVFNLLPSDWSTMNAEEKQAELLKYRLTFLKESTVNWCAALGTVLANDEVKDGFSERGGHPVEQKKMMQWSMRISAYAERLLQGLNHIDWPEPLKEMQRNWIGKSVGAMVRFSLIPNPSPKEKGAQAENSSRARYYATANVSHYELLKANSKENRKNATDAEVVLWNELRDSQTGFKIRRQHVIEGFIADFVCLPNKLVIEVDGDYHNDIDANEYDKIRTEFLNQAGFEVIRFTNEQTINNTKEVIESIKQKLTTKQLAPSPLERAEVRLAPSSLEKAGDEAIEVFTTRVDTIFGVSFLVIAPEHELVASLTTPEQKEDIDNYILSTKKKSELDRMSDVKTVSGAFTGSYASNPLNGDKIPIWIADYVLAGYGTGAVMGVPSGDQRDYLFAKKFNLPILQILDSQKIEKEADPTKEGKYINSGIIDGMGYKEASEAIVNKLKEVGMGYGKINYRMRDAIFGRQRYWGEPVPVYFKNGLPYLIKEEELPLLLPEVDKYLPTESGEPPLGRAKDWKYRASPQPSPKEREQLGSEVLSFGKDLGEAYEYELSTMPGWAGSSWYWYRYMDANNNQAFADNDKIAYWKDVDLYIGGSEHATGHLLYSRFWNKFLKDLGYVTEEEPFKKLINQGMIQGVSEKIYREGNVEKPESQTLMSNSFTVRGRTNVIEVDLEEQVAQIFYSADYSSSFAEDWFSTINVPIELVENSKLDIEKYITFMRQEKNSVVFVCNDAFYANSRWYDIVGDKFVVRESASQPVFKTKSEVEKMSKSKWNVINPDDLVERYGADTLRMYEMFLGPLEQSKPWNTNGIEGVFKFLRKFWKLFHDENFNFSVSDEAPTKAELKSLHRIIKKVEDDVERFSFNTSVSSFMIAVNELTDLKSNKRAILQDLVVILSPYAPHISEELWKLLGNNAGTLSYAPFPIFNPEHLIESEFNYPVSINGKTKTNINLALTLEPKEVEEIILKEEAITKYFDGKAPKKVIVVKGRIINIVI